MKDRGGQDDDGNGVEKGSTPPPHSDQWGGEWVLYEERPIWIRIALWSAAVAALAVGLYFWKGDAMRRYGAEWSAETHHAKAVEALEQGDGAVALRRALTSNELKPGHLPNLRVLFDAAKLTRDSKTLLFADAVFQHPEATTGDRLAALAAIEEAGDLASFDRLLEDLPADVRAERGVRILEWRSHLRRNRPERVVSAIDDGTAVGDPDLGLLKIHALLLQQRPATDNDAFDLALRILSSGGDDHFVSKLTALVSALEPHRLDSRLAAEIRKRLAQGAAFEGEGLPFLMANLEIAETPDRKDEIVEKTVGQHAADDFDDLCSWLLRLGEFQRIVDLSDEPHLLASPVAYRARVFALIDLGQFEDAFGALQFPPQSGDRVELFAIKAYVAKRLNRQAEEVSSWKAALLEAEHDLTQNHFLKLARLARLWGAEEVAVQSLVAACRNPRGILPPSAEVNWVIVRLFEEGKSDDLLSLTRRLLISEWDNPILLNNAVYLTMINSQQVDKAAVSLMSRLAKEHPEMPQIRNTLALAHTMLGEYALASGIYGPAVWDSGNWTDFSPSSKAVFAATMAKNGELEKARTIVEAIDWKSMMTRERAFFRGYILPLLKTDDEP